MKRKKQEKKIYFVAIHARENGSTKQIASKSCALALVRQLYHLNIIEAYTGEKKKKQIEKVSLTDFYLIQMNQRSLKSNKFHSDEIFQWKKIVTLINTLDTRFQNENIPIVTFDSLFSMVKTRRSFSDHDRYSDSQII